MFNWKESVETPSMSNRTKQKYDEIIVCLPAADRKIRQTYNHVRGQRRRPHVDRTIQQGPRPTKQTIAPVMTCAVHVVPIDILFQNKFIMNLQNEWYFCFWFTDLNIRIVHTQCTCKRTRTQALEIADFFVAWNFGLWLWLHQQKVNRMNPLKCFIYVYAANFACNNFNSNQRALFSAQTVCTHSYARSQILFFILVAFCVWLSVEIKATTSSSNRCEALSQKATAITAALTTAAALALLKFKSVKEKKCWKSNGWLLTNSQ